MAENKLKIPLSCLLEFVYTTHQTVEIASRHYRARCTSVAVKTANTFSPSSNYFSKVSHHNFLEQHIFLLQVLLTTMRVEAILIHWMEQLNSPFFRTVRQGEKKTQLTN